MPQVSGDVRHHSFKAESDAFFATVQQASHHLSLNVCLCQKVGPQFWLIKDTGFPYVKTVDHNGFLVTDELSLLHELRYHRQRSFLDQHEVKLLEKSHRVHQACELALILFAGRLNRNRDVFAHHRRHKGKFLELELVTGDGLCSQSEERFHDIR